MFRWLVLFLVLWNTIRSHPVTDEPEHVRAPRHLDAECCPCTGPRAGLRGDQADEFAAGSRAGVDDCPCRLRDADSEASPSFFLPRALHPGRPDLKPADHKEDHKPLLHPEVDLASSVLETLREVTDEEYQEAVARDAARSAAKSSESDLIIRDSLPETAKNIVTIILNPEPEEDGFVSEASNIQEARYIHTLENHSDNPIRSNEPQNLLKEIFDLAKREPKRLLHNVKDMDSGASNIKERVDNMNRGLEGLKLRSNPHVINLFPSKTKPINRNLKSSFNFRDTSKTMKSANKDCGNEDTNLNTNVPDFRFNKNTNAINTEKGLSSNKFDNPLFSKIRSNQAQRSNINSFSNIDNGASPSNVVDQLFESTNGQDTPLSRLKITPTSVINTQRPFSIKNLFKLKDVELILPKSNKAKITIPGLKLPPAIRSSNKNTDLNTLENERNSDTYNFDDYGEETKEKSNFNKELTPKNKLVETEILDAVPSPSENKPTVTVPNNNIENSRDHLDRLIPKNKQVSTEILDALQSPSENHQILSVNEDDSDTSIDQPDENTVIDTDLINSGVLQNSQEILTINTSKNSEEGLENDDFNNNNVIIIEDGNVENLVIENGQTNKADGMTDVESDELITEDFSENQDFDTDTFEEDFPHESETNNVDLTPDTVPDTSNDVALILPQEEIDINDETISSDNSFRAAEPCQNDHQDNFGSNTTQVAKLKTSTTNSEEPSQFEQNSHEESGELISKNENIDCQEEESGKSEESPEKTNQVNIQDLQKLSNSILDMSIRKNSHGVRIIDCDTTTQHKHQSNEVNDNKRENSSFFTDETDRTDLESSATSPQIKVLDTFSNPLSSTDDLPQDNKKNQARQNIDLTNESNESDNIKAKGCLTNLQHSKPDDIKTRDNVNPNEMTAEASAPVINIVPQATSKAFKNTGLGSSLLQDIIMQPSSLFEGNNLFRRPLPDIGNLINSNTQLPTLDDIQSSIPNILDRNEKHADEEDWLSTDIDNDNDCSNSSPVMSTDSSTTNSKTIFPALKPLENINLDIFQLNPLTQARIPRLNLNSYKAKLALPKSLELKPIRLQSSLGKNGGLLGATLTFGPDKIGSARNTNPSFNRKIPDMLKSRLGSISNLNDLRATMKTNAKNLLKSPLMRTGDNLRSGHISALSDNFRFHTANTMKNIQQTLASTLNEATVKGDRFAKPQDLLEMVSTARDDVSDKLQAMHSDLTDRLTSLHESIVDQSKLPSLQVPALKDTRHFKPKPRNRPNTLLKTTQSSLSPKPYAHKGNPQGAKSSAHSRTFTEQNKFKPFKISKAASTLTPKSVEVPKLTTTSSKPLFTRPLQRDTHVKLKENNPNEITKEPIKPQDVKVLRNKFYPYGESKTISTTARPSTKTIFITKTPQFTKDRLQATSKTDNIRNKPKILRQHLKPNIDSKGFASEVRPSIIPMPVNPNHPPKTAITNTEAMTPKIRSQLRQSSLSEGTKPKPPLLNQSSGSSTPKLTSGSVKPKAPALSDRTISISENEPSARNIKPQPLAWPKATDPAFLSKVREALRARFPNLNINKPTEMVRTSTKVQPLGSEDMVRSASENKEVALFDEKPLKENVSYRCRMVCVREPIEP